jgi:hypothetical protein
MQNTAEEEDRHAEDMVVLGLALAAGVHLATLARQIAPRRLGLDAAIASGCSSSSSRTKKRR